MTEREHTDPIVDRQLDMVDLKALAHPLRVQILDVLSVYGDFTASGLAERLGESSGATSYHLRQLEKHGFVREVVGKGTARERWWQRTPGGLNFNATEMDMSPSVTAASRTVVREWGRNRAALLEDFQERGLDVLPIEWAAATIVSTVNAHLTVEQLAEITDAWNGFVEPFVERFRGQNRDTPGTRPVQLHFNAFPVIDAPEVPGAPTPQELS